MPLECHSGGGGVCVGVVVVVASGNGGSDVVHRQHASTLMKTNVLCL